MSNDVEKKICVFTFTLFFEVTKTCNKQGYVKFVKICDAVLRLLKVYVIYNVYIMYWHCAWPVNCTSTT